MLLCAREQIGNARHRFDATGKRYRYRVARAPVLSPFDRWFVWHAPDVRDVDAIRSAAACLVGTHDFSAFAWYRIAFGIVVGGVWVDLSAAKVMNAFPLGLFMILVGVTFLFALASTNGTMEKLAAYALRACGGQTATAMATLKVLAMTKDSSPLIVRISF